MLLTFAPTVCVHVSDTTLSHCHQRIFEYFQFDHSLQQSLLSEMMLRSPMRISNIKNYYTYICVSSVELIAMYVLLPKKHLLVTFAS